MSSISYYDSSEYSSQGGVLRIGVDTQYINGGLLFQLKYTLEGEGESPTIRPFYPKENQYSSVAVFAPTNEVIDAVNQVMRYFQYAKMHLVSNKTHPLQFKGWQEKQ